MSQERRPRAFIPAPWVHRAACAGTDPALWFPSEERRPHSHTDRARTICAGCGVRRECLDYALTTPEPDGIWGGLTPEERLKLKRAR